jgi:hypothetical protein
VTPQIPGYVLTFETILRPLVMTIGLSLIWLGAARMPGAAKSRYTTAGVLSAVFIGWEVVAQYLGAANTYLATIENPPTVPTILFGLLIPLAVAGIALWQSESIARLVAAIPLHWLVAAQVYRVAGGIFLVLWADGRLPWQFALPAGIGDVVTGILAVVVAAPQRVSFPIRSATPRKPSCGLLVWFHACLVPGFATGADRAFRLCAGCAGVGAVSAAAPVA